jgi:dsDNA-specific endonuclease/ATPase MutS2
MDKLTAKALHSDAILAWIQPAGELGRHYKLSLPVYKPGQETLLKHEYDRLAAFISILQQNPSLQHELEAVLSHLAWLPNTIRALSERSLYLHECFELKQYAYYASRLCEICTKSGLDQLYRLPDLSKAMQLLDPENTLVPTFQLSAGFDQRLGKLIAKLQSLQLQRRHLEKELAEQARQTLGLTRSQSEVVISRLQTEQVKLFAKSAYYRLSSENFANLTFKLQDNPALKQLRHRIELLTQKLKAAEERALTRLSIRLRSQVRTFSSSISTFSRLDWDFAKVIFALRCAGCIPVITKKTSIAIYRAENLFVKHSFEESERKYQPLDLVFSGSVNVLTGPNMGGKTTALVTLGQMCLLSSMAIPLPAKTASLPLFDHIWFNQEDAGQVSLSSFGREVVSLSAVLKKKGRQLLLIDELAKGTNPVEGEAILSALLVYLKEHTCFCLATTHYEQPAHLPFVHQFAIRGVDIAALSKLSQNTAHNLTISLQNLNQIMDYSLVALRRKQAPPQTAIAIAAALGLPTAIIELAQAKNPCRIRR